MEMNFNSLKQLKKILQLVFPESRWCSIIKLYPKFIYLLCHNFTLSNKIHLYYEITLNTPIIALHMIPIPLYKVLIFQLTIINL